MAIAIKVEQLSKKYILRHEVKEPYVALRDVLSTKVKQAGQRMIGRKSYYPAKEEFYALKDLSFDIHQGERVGIIGRNGAGKSTLLKVLSRITEPSSGRVSIKGRIASLLEVGTGFHPELTGRENIFLNGSILGMSRPEIQRKFDEIVAFSEVERFLDTPVKRYSSGMYVRLAFSVAAHLEPEILVVDEVLAVGDAEFQKKCLGKMKDVSSSGRTVLFVSHNMAAIQNLCNTAIYLREGQLISMGKRDAVISEYLRSVSESYRVDLNDRKDRQGNGSLRFVAFALKDKDGKAVASLQTGEEGRLCLEIQGQDVVSKLRNVHIALGIDDELGQRISNLNNEVSGNPIEELEGGSAEIEILLPKVPFHHGNYSFTLYSTVNNEVADWIANAGSFNVEQGDFYGSGKILPEGQGKIYIEHSFKVNTIR